MTDDTTTRLSKLDAEGIRVQTYSDLSTGNLKRKCTGRLDTYEHDNGLWIVIDAVLNNDIYGMQKQNAKLVHKSLRSLALLNKGGKPNFGKIKQMADTNKDGKVSVWEWIKWAISMGASAIALILALLTGLQ